MSPRTLSRIGALFVAVLSISVLPTHAQNSLPDALEFRCAAYDLASESGTCYLQVPAETLGVEMQIEIPEAALQSLGDPDRAPELPNTSMFLALQNQDQGSNTLMEIAYFALESVEALNEDYFLIQFQVSLQETNAANFPVTIPTQLQVGSEMYSIDSLAGSEAHFRATDSIELPLIIDLIDRTGGMHGSADTTGTSGSTTTTTGGSGSGGSSSTGGISSSFNVQTGSGGGGGGGGGGGLSNARPAGFQKCFDDELNAMSLEEWEIICRAKSLGIISGNPRDDGTFFFPYQPINRAEAVKILTLGILRLLGVYTNAELAQENEQIVSRAVPGRTFLYPDIRYENDGSPPWFALYVSLATEAEIATGYPQDGTFRPANKINNAESYRVIVETGRVASDEIGNDLRRATLRTQAQDWFMKYAETLNIYGLDYSEDYAEFTARKDFLILVMKLLESVGAITL